MRSVSSYGEGESPQSHNPSALLKSGACPDQPTGRTAALDIRSSTREAGEHVARAARSAVISVRREDEEHADGGARDDEGTRGSRP